jgi:hypothetical protein
LGQDRLSDELSSETRLQVLKSAADNLSQRRPVSKRVNGSKSPGAPGMGSASTANAHP